MKTNECNKTTMASNPHDREQRIVNVENLANDSQSMYMNITPINALINDYMVNNKLSSQLHSTTQRDSIKSLIVSGNKTWSIGDLCVLKFG